MTDEEARKKAYLITAELIANAIYRVEPLEVRSALDRIARAMSDAGNVPLTPVAEEEP